MRLLPDFSTGIKVALMAIGLVLLTPARQLDAQPKSIHWLVNDIPPLYIVRGEHAGTGVIDKVIGFFADKLPQYQMIFTEMNSKRFWHELDKGHKYCRAEAFRSEQRQKLAIFSIPVYLAPPARLVLHRSDWIDLGKPSSLNLSTLLSNPNYQGAVTEQASYGSTIDAILKQNEHSADKNLTRKVTKPRSLLAMITLRRISYTVENSLFINTYQAKVKDHNLIAVNIDEEANYYTLHVACTKNDWGKSVIRDINELLIEYRHSKDFLDNLRLNGKLLNQALYLRYFEEFSKLK